MFAIDKRILVSLPRYLIHSCMIEIPSEKVILFISIFCLLFFIICIVFFISQNIYVNHRIRLEREAKQKLIDSQEDERYRIAADLHDNMGIKFTSMNMFAEGIKFCLHDIQQHLHEPQYLDDKMLETHALINKVIEGNTQAYHSLRHTIYAITPFKMEELGLLGSLQELCEQSIESSLSFDYTHSETHLTFSKNAQIAIYRIVQELINNTLKHAQASKIKLQVMIDDTMMKIIYEDNGQGISNINIHNAGFGMQTLRLRTEQLKGRISLSNNEPRGVRYTLVFNNSDIRG